MASRTARSDPAGELAYLRNQELIEQVRANQVNPPLGPIRHEKDAEDMDMKYMLTHTDYDTAPYLVRAT